MQAQQQAPTTGHVYETQCEGIFGVVSYFPETVVQLALLTNGESVAQACKVLASRFAGKFIPADKDTEAWGKVSFRAQGSAIMM